MTDNSMPKEEHLTLMEAHHELRSWLLILTIVVAIMAIAMIFLSVFVISKHYDNLDNRTYTHGRLNNLEDSMKTMDKDMRDMDKRQTTEMENWKMMQNGGDASKGAQMMDTQGKNATKVPMTDMQREEATTLPMNNVDKQDKMTQPAMRN